MFSKELAGVAFGAAAVGFFIGSGITTGVYLTRASALASDLQVKTTRVRVLEGLLLASPDSPAAASFMEPLPRVALASRDPDPPPESVAPAAPRNASAPPVVATVTSKEAPGANQKEVKKDPPKVAPKVEAKPAVKPAQQLAISPAVASAVATQGSASTQAAATNPAPAAPPAPAPKDLPVTKEDVEQVVAKNPVVGVSADRLGVARVDGGGVYLKSGRYIRVGERFTSGERLLQVDAQNSRIVTSDRQLLLFFQPS